MDTTPASPLLLFIARRPSEPPAGEMEECGVVAADEQAALALVRASYDHDDWTIRPYRMGSGNEAGAGAVPHIVYAQPAPERGPAVCANDLYAMKPLHTRNVVWRLLNGEHFPEIDSYKVNEEAVTNDGRLEVRVVADPYVDSEYTCTLSTVWFDGKPFMVIQNAGKRNDHTREFITDEDLYYKVVAYLKTFYPPDDRRETTDPTAKLRELTSFGGYPDILLTREE